MLRIDTSNERGYANCLLQCNGHAQQETFSAIMNVAGVRVMPSGQQGADRQFGSEIIHIIGVAVSNDAGWYALYLNYMTRRKGNFKIITIGKNGCLCITLFPAWVCDCSFSHDGKNMETIDLALRIAGPIITSIDFIQPDTKP